MNLSRIVMMLIFLVLGCGAGHVRAADNQLHKQLQTTDEVELIEWALEPWIGGLDGMVKRRSIRVLTSVNRTHYFLDGARERGLTFEYMKEFEKYLNKNLKSNINAIFIPARRDQLIPWLVEGRGDIACANLTITAARQKEVNFAAAIIDDIDEIVAQSLDGAAITSRRELAGRSVYVRQSSSYYNSLKALNAEFNKAGLAPVKIRTISEDLETEDILEMVNAGLLPVTIIDSHLAAFWSQIFTDVNFRRDVSVNSGRSISCAIRKNNPKLKQKLNAFIKKRKKGTTFGNVIHNRYLRDIKYVKKALSEKEINKFNKMSNVFKKYAGQFDFDYLMLMALAYQESGLDNSVTSPAGAVGIMQIRPTTAAIPEVDVKNVRKLENNVLAGTKYLRFIADTYFADSAISPVDRILFSFAAYNAGPTRISRLRQKAPRMGIDPNIWFRNVENLAAKKIGKEPVQYVRNIFKYYVSYKLITERQDERDEVKSDLN